MAVEVSMQESFTEETSVLISMRARSQLSSSRSAILKKLIDLKIEIQQLFLSSPGGSSPDTPPEALRTQSITEKPSRLFITQQPSSLLFSG